MPPRRRHRRGSARRGSRRDPRCDRAWCGGRRRPARPGPAADRGPPRRDLGGLRTRSRRATRSCSPARATNGRSSVPTDPWPGTNGPRPRRPCGRSATADRPAGARPRYPSGMATTTPRTKDTTPGAPGAPRARAPPSPPPRRPARRRRSTSGRWRPSCWPPSSSTIRGRTSGRSRMPSRSPSTRTKVSSGRPASRTSPTRSPPPRSWRSSGSTRWPSWRPSCMTSPRTPSTA